MESYITSWKKMQSLTKPKQLSYLYPVIIIHRSISDLLSIFTVFNPINGSSLYRT